MDKKTTEVERNIWVARVYNALMACGAGDDIEPISSHAFNFPCVSADGQEYWVEVTVSIPKEGGDEGYEKREEYALKQKKALERAAEREKKKEKSKKEKEKAE